MLKKEDNLRLIVLENCWELGSLVNQRLKLIRNCEYDYIVPIENPVFANSESKIKILESVRGKDLFIITDVGNYDLKYTMFGETNRKSYNDNYMDTLQTIDACASTTYRTWLIEPLLFGSRQHKREGRESLNCALSLRILENMGVNGIITYDAHDPTVRSSLNRTSFDNIYPTNTMLDYFLDKEDINFNELLVINPDSGAAKRANYFGKILDAPVGGFRKARDTSNVINGTCQIKEHEYVGNVALNGKNLIVVDDIIASGKSMIDVATSAKNNGANKIFLFTTFGLFSDGEKSIELFNSAYENGYIDKIYVTNLTYIPERIKSLPWIETVDCSENIAKVINTLNNDDTLEPLMNGKEKIQDKVKVKKIESKKIY